MYSDQAERAASPDLPIASSDGLANPKRLFALFALALGISMAVLDGSIVNVVLPVIAAEQNIVPSHAIWIVTAYQFAVVVALLPLAALGETIGFRKVYIGGLVFFALASAMCAQATNLEMLVTGRILQGLGGAALMSINGALVRHVMPRRSLGSGLAIMGITVGVAGAAGPGIAAAILSVASWHWLFLINVPLGAIAWAISMAVLPATPKSGEPFDVPSALLNVVTFGFLIWALGGLAADTPVAMTLLQLGIAAASGYVLVRRQLSRKAPMLPIDLLSRWPFAVSVITSICAFAAYFLTLVSVPFYLHSALGFDEVTTGLLITPWPLATAFIMPLSGWLADHYRNDLLSSAGLVVFAGALVLVGLLPEHAGQWDVIWRMALCGVGFGLFLAPNNRAMIQSAPHERSGSASGIQSTARLLGQSIGGAIAAILFNTIATPSIAAAAWCAALFGLLAALISLTRDRQCAG